MELYIEKDDITKNIQIDKETPIKDILNKEDIPLETVIIVKNEKICLEDEVVTNQDKLKVLSVVSGG